MERGTNHMKILVIGGSYFLGRVFVMQAAPHHEITVLNRGTYSMEALGVNQIKGDRTDINLWQKVTDDYDAIVDFCGYNKGDISTVLSYIKGKVKHYIFISTVDVYEHGSFNLKDEDYKYENREIQGETGNYIKGKIALENELKAECGTRNISYTIIRPSIIYGPFNYAPRESVYIQLIVQNRVLPHITDAQGKFQLVYVKDVAEAVIKCITTEKSYNQTYNISSDEIMDYNDFYQSLKEVSDIEFTEIPMTIQTAESQNIPLPFPLTEIEAELSSNTKSKTDLEIKYTPIKDGMAKTYNAFKNVFMPQ
jgi:nucleoside-diphosphate-sugar epimerase